MVARWFIDVEEGNPSRLAVQLPEALTFPLKRVLAIRPAYKSQRARGCKL